MSTKTLELVRSIDLGRVSRCCVGELIELARLNKVLLGFLRRIGFEGSLRVVEEERYRWYLGEVARVLEVLDGLDYALFKFRRPVEHVSVDIDILIDGGHVWRAVERLMKVGFRVEVLEPYTVTMIRNRTIVDLYTYPSFAWIVYLDGRRLLEEVEVVKIGKIGVEARALTPEAEAVVTAAHAIYKEHIYLLADYYVVKQWLNNKAIDLACELHVEEAVQLSLSLNKQIEEGLIEVPMKLRPTQVVKILAKKFAKDPSFRITSLNLVKLVPKKRTVQQLIYRMKRGTY